MLLLLLLPWVAPERAGAVLIRQQHMIARAAALQTAAQLWSTFNFHPKTYPRSTPSSVIPTRILPKDLSGATASRRRDILSAPSAAACLTLLSPRHHSTPAPSRARPAKLSRPRPEPLVLPLRHGTYERHLSSALFVSSDISIGLPFHPASHADDARSHIMLTPQ